MLLNEAVLLATFKKDLNAVGQWGKFSVVLLKWFIFFFNHHETNVWPEHSTIGPISTEAEGQAT